MKIAILATGHEVVAGDILNTNTQKIAYDLSSNGLDVVTHFSCRDVLEEMLAALKFLANVDVIITIGGLGPTCDDITRFAVAKHLKLALFENPIAQKHLTKYQKKSTVLNIQNRKQETLFPQNALLLDNPFGTAMGAWIEAQHQTIIMLPGPPRECLPMWEQQVLPKLLAQVSAELPWMRWLVFGIPESALIDDLDALLKDIPHELGYRCSMPYVELKVQADEPYRADIELILDKYCQDKQLFKNEKASDALKKYLKDNPVKFSIKDSLTGGLLETMLMSPDMYNKLSFREEYALHFNISGLHDYWHQIEPKSHVACFFQIGEHLDKYEPSLRSAFLPHYAMEWTCFCILKYFRRL